jgi:hypothetical protein
MFFKNIYDKTSSYFLSERELELLIKDCHKKRVLNLNVHVQKENSDENENENDGNPFNSANQQPNMENMDIAFAVDIIHSHRFYLFIHADISNIKLTPVQFDDILQVKFIISIIFL